MTHTARTLGSRLAAATALFCIAAATIAGCGGTSATTPARGAPGGPTRPAVTPTQAVHPTGNLCADAATANASIRTLTQALVLRHGGQQQVTRALRTAAATYAALGSEAPAPLKGAFAALATYYQSVEAKVANGGRLTLSDIEPAAHPGVAPAVRQVSRYFLAHCAS
jgi:hypothetical protein